MISKLITGAVTAGLLFTQAAFAERASDGTVKIIYWQAP